MTPLQTIQMVDQAKWRALTELTATVQQMRDALRTGGPVGRLGDTLQAHENAYRLAADEVEMTLRNL